MAPSVILDETELNRRLDIIVQLGFPISNIKIHPDTQPGISRQLYKSRSETWGCKVLGAFIGTKEFIKNSLSIKINEIKSLSDDLLKYPNSQARYYIHKYCFNEKINYWLRAQFPDDSKNFLDDFKRIQLSLIASYHGIYDQEKIDKDPMLFLDLYKRASFPIDDGGLALRSIDNVYLTAFICSMAASSKFLAKNFPQWIQFSIVDDVPQIAINENISLHTSNQIMFCVQKIQSIVPNGHFEGLNHPAPIIKKLVELSNQKSTLLEPDNQSLDESPGLLDRPFKHSSSQSALYQQLIAADFNEFKKHKEDLANTNNPQQRPYNKLYYRNLMSSINPTSGAWLLAGMSHPSFLLSPFEFTAAMCRRNTIHNTSIPTFNCHGTDNPQNYQCPCYGRSTMIDQFGYHLTGCKIDGGAIRMHDNLVHTIVTLFRSIGLSVALEPLNMFSNHVPDDNRRPDILIRNPYDGGSQIVIDASISSFNSSARTNDNTPQQVVIAREKQKIGKYGEAAKKNHIRLCPASFSTTGEMGPAIKNLFLQQIRLKLQLVDGEVK